MPISDRAAPSSTRESALDALDLDPKLSLPALVAALGELASQGDPARAEFARRTFERLTERPEAHFDELLLTVPRLETPLSVASPPALAPLRLTDVLPSLASRMGPLTAAERAVFAVPREDA